MLWRIADSRNDSRRVAKRQEATDVSPSRRSKSVEPTAREAYEVRVRGKLSDAFVQELGAERVPDSDTALRVDVRDRADLHTFMRRIEDLGIEVVSINPGAGTGKRSAGK